MEAKVEMLRNQRRKKFMTRGITFAVASGICYGLYTGFLTLAETQGVWGDWFAGTEWGNGNAALNAFTITFTLAALAAGINDLFSGIWSIAVCGPRDDALRDNRRTLRDDLLCDRPQLGDGFGKPWSNRSHSGFELRHRRDSRTHPL